MSVGGAWEIFFQSRAAVASSSYTNEVEGVIADEPDHCSPKPARFPEHDDPGAAAFTTRGLFADELVRTPRQTEGPFYPNKLPLDTDNDLLVINDGITPAVGEVTYLTGRILDAKGGPVRNALVEIWQVDNNGAYIHTEDPHGEKHDKNFQGFGRFLTGSTGEYYFRTIKPVLYTGRTRHIHFKIKKRIQRSS